MDLVDVGMTLGDIVTDNARRFPEVTAYQLAGQSVTHAGLRERAGRLVSAMTAAGVQRQDRIAVLGRNSVAFGELLAATQLSGIVLATISVRLSRPELLDALRRVTPRIVFCDEEFAATIAELASQLPAVRMLVTLGTSSYKDMLSIDEFAAAGGGGEPALVARPEDIACLVFTSGTTGASKCCVLGQRELCRVALTMNAEMRSGSMDCALINMPMFHFGAIGIIGGLHARGGTVVLQRQFGAAEAVQIVMAERITVLHLAPVMLGTLIDHMGARQRLDSVRTVVYSAAPMPVNTLRRAMSALPHANFLNLYGQTEAIVSGLPAELHRIDSPAAADTLRSVGFPFPGVRVRVVDDNGRDVARGEPGEITVWSDSLFRGYWDDQAATLATLRDGWCHTGDVGRLDERGLLFLVDRKKDVIITGGENVYCPEVEDAVSSVDGVADCAVVGVCDQRWGEAVCAVVVPSAGALPTLEVIQHAVRLRLAGYKVPRRLVLVDDLPLLASGKVDKKQLRANLARGDLAPRRM